jgi:hypothetical protein
MFLAGTALIVLGVHSLPPSSGAEDFIEDFVSARAILEGKDPYAPLNDLIQRYVPMGLARFPHSNAHPPLLMLASVPLVPLSYELAAPLWFALSIVLLFLVGRSLKLSPWASLAFAAWPPIWGAIGLGGSEMVLLAIIVAAWALARERRDWPAGALLGLAAALKLFPALLFVPYVARRRFHVVAGGVFSFGLGQAVNVLLVGPAALANYYFRALPAFNQMFVGDVVNISPHGALLRIFGGAADLSPIVSAPFLVLPLTVVISLIGLVGLVRLRPEAGAVALLVLLPSVWTNYAALAMPQVVYLWRTRERRLLTVLVMAAASWPLPFALGIPSFWLFVRALGPAANVFLDVVGAVQAIGLVGLLTLSWLAEREYRPNGHARSPGAEGTEDLAIIGISP